MNEEILLGLIPKDGKAIGNKTLIIALKNKNFTEDEFWRVRNSLIESGKLSKGKGKGGSVYRTEIIKADDSKLDSTPKKKRIKENELYAPFIKVVKDYRVKEYDIDDYLIDNTSSQGKKRTGGKWTRPDVSLISIKSYQYIYGKIMEVITFEIKPEDSYGVESVFETASQSVFAHKSFLCIHLTQGKPETEDFDRIIRQCELFGVGLIVFEKPEDWETYEVVVDPKRKDPDPNEVNLFIKQQMSESTRESLSRKIK